MPLCTKAKNNSMSKVIGIGETVTDFIIRNDQPEAMVCGGSCYNSMISIGRCGVEALFIGEVGNDRLGLRTRQMLEANGVNADYLTLTEGKKSQLSLAFLNDRNDAEYVFYKDHASDIFPLSTPVADAGDVVLYGSFYALNPVIHPALSRFLAKAEARGAIIYYDINFRASHLADKDRISSELLDNLNHATIVRGSDEDFRNLFDTDDADTIYNKIGPRCDILIITRGSGDVSIMTEGRCKDYSVEPARVVSTVGAGDSFNAGFVCALVRQGVTRSQLPNLPDETVDYLVDTATRFGREVCGTTDNYISLSTGQQFRNESVADS